MVFRLFRGLYIVEEVPETKVLLIDIPGIVGYNHIIRSINMPKIAMNFGISAAIQ